MSLLIESIKIYNGRIYNLSRHQARVNHTGATNINLRASIKIPKKHLQGLVKCRILYDQSLQKITYSPYQKKMIKSLQLVHHDSIDYSHKYADRDLINELYQQRGEADDIIIVKQGMLTDSSYSNIVLRKNGKWYTPDSHLLSGTRRAQLIDQGKIIPKVIKASDIRDYDCISLINAMMGLSDCQVRDIRK